MNRYLIAKSAISLGKAVLVGGILWGFGLSIAFLMTVLVFLLNFIPNIGPLLAASMPLAYVRCKRGLTKLY
ncbi:AI-2E family transporter [Vibrio lentus]|nr:AI-2E family transporter [Vibrio lentus]